MVIRHGEEPDGSHPGVDAQGNKDDSSSTFTKTADGRQFAQVPELVLPGDKNTVIKN
jgi:hypothetical protein